MSTNSKETKCKRARKAKPNKKNIKKNLERIGNNAAILRELASKE
jgi:hypothetical protein